MTPISFHYLKSMNNLKRLLYNGVLIFKYVFGKTKQYYSGGKKSKLQIFKDLIIWQIREGEFNNMYYAMGLDLSGSKQSEYLGRKSFLRIKKTAEKCLIEKGGFKNINYDVITKDKFYANSILTANGISCIQNLALIKGSFILFPEGRSEELESLLKLAGSFFIKNIVLEAGEGVYMCKIVNNKIEVNNLSKNLNEFKTFLGDKIWVVQKQYCSHETFSKINSTALNTTRIYTILDDNEPVYLGGYQGFATNNSLTDSWSHGSLYVGINIEKGCLSANGLTSISDKRQGWLSSHPDSDIIFEGYPVPYLNEAVDLCIRAHRFLYFNFIVGWDVAITDEGPVIVEANENPGINVLQCLNGGMRSKVQEKYVQILGKNGSK